MRSTAPTIQSLEKRLLFSGNTGMTNVGEILLASGDGAQYQAAIDTTTHFGYFGSAGNVNPATLSMVNLNGPQPTLVAGGPVNIPSGASGLLAILVDTSNADPAKHFIYVGCDTGQIFKMSMGDATHAPQVISTITGAGTILCGSLDTAHGYAYFGVSGSTKSVLRLRLSDFTLQGSETLNLTSLRMCAIDTIHQYLYFSSFAGAGNTIPALCKVNLATFTPGGASVATYNMNSTTPGDGIARAGLPYPAFDEGLLVDPVNSVAYIGSYNTNTSNETLNQTQWPNDQSLVVRVNLGTTDAFPAHPLTELDLQLHERDLSTAEFDPVHGNIYFGTDNTYPAHVYMIHVGNGTGSMTEIGRLDLNKGTKTSYPPDGDTNVNSDPTQWGEIYLRSSIIDQSTNTLYFGTDTATGQVIKVSINGPAQLAFTIQPTDTVAGSQIDNPGGIKVAVEDAGGNIITTDTSSVTLTLNGGSFSSGTLTASAINGIATFSDLVINSAASYTITAADGALGSATSSSFNVTLPAVVSGKVFQDNNADAIFNGTDTGIANQVVYLDYNNNGAQDAGEPTTTTDPSGNYSFSNLPSGLTGTVTLAAPPTANFVKDSTGSAAFATSSGSSSAINFAYFPTTFTSSNTYLVDLDAATGKQLQIFLNGALTYTAPSGLPPSLKFDLTSASGSLTVDETNGNPIPAGGISYLGGAGANSLTIDTPAGTNTVSLSASQILVNASAISYVNTAGLIISAASGSNTFTQSGAPGNGAALSISAGGGSAAASITFAGDGPGVHGVRAYNLASLTLLNNGAATLAAPASNLSADSTLLTTASLSVATGGVLDITSNSIDVNYGGGFDPIGNVQALVNTNLITSSLAGDSIHAVGYADGKDGVVAGLNSGDILIRYTVLGDLNLDGNVNFTDLLQLAQHYGKTGSSWDQGDFNGDSTTNFSDLLALAQHYGVNLPRQISAPVSAARHAKLKAAMARFSSLTSST